VPYDEDGDHLLPDESHSYWFDRNRYPQREGACRTRVTSSLMAA